MCCGGVVFDKLARDARIVLIEVDKGRHKQWLLPKGHVHMGEDYETAALREVSEETGIGTDKLRVLAYLGKIDYSFPPVPRTELHRKTVHFFAMLSETSELKISKMTREEGIASAHWFTMSAAKEVVRYDGNREIIERAEELLDHMLSRNLELINPA